MNFWIAVCIVGIENYTLKMADIDDYPRTIDQ